MCIRVYIIGPLKRSGPSFSRPKNRIYTLVNTGVYFIGVEVSCFIVKISTALWRSREICCFLYKSICKFRIFPTLWKYSVINYLWAVFDCKFLFSVIFRHTCINNKNTDHLQIVFGSILFEKWVQNIQSNKQSIQTVLIRFHR